MTLHTLQPRQCPPVPSTCFAAEAGYDPASFATPSHATLERLRLSATSIDDKAMDHWLTQDNLRDFFDLFI